MTKGGIHAFTRSLATHLIPKGIRVNAVAPGPVWTPLNPADRAAKGVAQFGGDTTQLALERFRLPHRPDGPQLLPAGIGHRHKVLQGARCETHRDGAVYERKEMPDGPVERPYGAREAGSKYQGQAEPTASRFYLNFEQRDANGARAGRKGARKS